MSESNPVEPIRDNMRSISDSFAEIKEFTKELEKRMRKLETDEIDRLKESIYKLESSVSHFKTANDDYKDRWNMALNFIVQLIWVVMASYVLAKLGLGTGLP